MSKHDPAWEVPSFRFEDKYGYRLPPEVIEKITKTDYREAGYENLSDASRRIGRHRAYLRNIKHNQPDTFNFIDKKYDGKYSDKYMKYELECSTYQHMIGTLVSILEIGLISNKVTILTGLIILGLPGIAENFERRTLVRGCVNPEAIPYKYNIFIEIDNTIRILAEHIISKKIMTKEELLNDTGYKYV